MKVTPRGDRVLVEVDYEPETVTGAGIIIPEATKAAPQRGKVLAIGEGFRDADGVLHPVTGLKVGDIVIYGKHAGTAIEEYGASDERKPKLALYREIDILAVIEHA